MENPDVGVTTDQVFMVALDKEKILADSVSSLVITVTLKEKSDPNKDVTFSTDHGRFGGADEGENNNPQVFTILASGRTAEARLISGTEPVNEVGVVVTVGSFSKLLFVSFTPALPDDFFITSDKLKLMADRTETATLTAQLFRNEGKVSDGTSVTFTVKFREGSDAEAEITPVSFTMKETASATLRSISENPGIVTVTAETTIRDGTKKSKEIDIEFLPPGWMDPQYLVLDSQIGPGTSGGPLIDKHGRMIGVITTIGSKLESYALPMDLVLPIVSGWLEDLELERQWQYQRYTSQWNRSSKSIIITGLIAAAGVAFYVFFSK